MYLSDEIFEGAPWYLGVPTLHCLSEVCAQHIHTHTEIRLIEIIGHIPANLNTYYTMYMYMYMYNVYVHVCK